MLSELSNLRPNGKSQGHYYKLAVILGLALDSTIDIFIYDINIIL